MIKLVEMCHLNTIKKKILFSLILLMISILFLIGKPNATSDEVKLFNLDFYYYHMPILKITLFILSATLLTVFAYDHDQAYLKPFLVKNLKMRIAGAKLTYYLLYVFLLMSPIYITFLIVPMIFHYYQGTLDNEILFIFDLTIDHMIMVICILILVCKKSEVLAYLILIIRIIMYLLYEDINSKLFYFLPLINYAHIEENYYFSYKIAYLFLLIIVYFIKIENFDV